MIEFIKPEEIEARSFEIIAEELAGRGIELAPENKDVIMRVIHTTADFDYAESLKFSDGAVRVARELIQEGAHIVTDTNMAKAGINKARLARFGGEVHCFMADEDVAAEAKSRGLTRAAVSMERAAALGKKVIFALGNAPTAMIALHEMKKCGIYRPDFVIGVPVGFVNVVAAKELFLAGEGGTNGDAAGGADGKPVPYIINAGRKGGSTVAAAICNALLYGIKE